MRTKAGILAYAGQILSTGCVIWIVAATLLQKDNEVPLPGLAFTLLLTAVTGIVYLLILRKSISIPVLAIVSAVLLAAQITAYILVYKGGITVGYILTIVLMALICVYVPMYYCIREQSLTKHLIFIDLMILLLVWLFLFLPVLNISSLSVVCAVLVTLVDMGGAVCLRMSEGGMNEGTGKAFALAMGASAAAAAVVFILVKLFSRSGRVTGAVLSGIRAFFAMIWGWIEAFAEWISQFFTPEKGEVVLEPTQTMSGIDEEIIMEETAGNLAWVLIVIAAAAVVIALIAVFRMRKKRARIRMASYGGTKIVRRKNRKKTAGLWKKLLDRFIFKKNAFLYRNTPSGVLVWLEKRAVRKKEPRGKGESVREFIFRLSPEGTLQVLADDLDAGLYGKEQYSLSAGDCRELKRKYRIERKKKEKGEK